MRDAVTDFLLAASRWRTGGFIRHDQVSRSDDHPGPFPDAAARTPSPEAEILDRIDEDRAATGIPAGDQAATEREALRPPGGDHDVPDSHDSPSASPEGEPSPTG